MFLDPDPRLRRRSGSGFFSSQRPVVSPRDRSATWRRKPSPLEERSQSENNRRDPTTNQLKTTVRLVKPGSESPTDIGSENNGDFTDREENTVPTQYLESPPSSPTDIIEASVIKPGSPRFAGSDQGFRVSDTHTPANEALTPTRFDHENLLSSDSGYAIPTSTWLRRSGSSGRFSKTSTLEESGSGYEQKSSRTESRTSEGSTLRHTPTPTELDYHERVEAEETLRQTSEQKLETLKETSPERSTVRLIATPAESPSSSNYSSPGHVNLPPALPSASPSDSEQESNSWQRSSQRTSSAGSLPAPNNLPDLPISPTVRYQRSQESAAPSGASSVAASSPNLVAFCSDSSRPRSQSQPLHAASSIDSIQSRLQDTTTIRPATGRSAASGNSWSSRPATSDTLPPLQLPKKRLRHKPASSDLNATTASASDSTMEDDTDFDTQPYPRHPFSMHLSTIASESDPQSRTASQHLSHFSLGSGVLTGDDSSSMQHSGTWPRRRESLFDEYTASEISPIVSTTNDEPADMTTGVSREGSALPQPLFQARSSSAPFSDKRYEGRLPPLPPIPKSRDSEEGFDTVPELSRPSLHKQRSGYSLRRRSQSTPSYAHSRQVSLASESSRWSQGTNIFPTWAKAYYVYGATLLSSSQISLSAPEEIDRSQTLHVYKFNREWGAPSISTSFDTSYSAGPSVSPASSRFLPSIFRPRAKREKSGISKKAKNKSPKPSPRAEDSRPDSMAISRDPIPSGQQDVLPSSQTRYGESKDESDRHHPLPRTYSKHKKWDQMHFPRPMSKDVLTGYGSEPHLYLSKRTKPSLSAWRAPSFVESLDTLVRSRCNRQILFFALGFVCPLFWIVASFLPLPKKPLSDGEYEKARTIGGGSEDDIQAAMMKHEAGDAEKRWREERQWLKARWWRYLNRIMSVIGVLVIGAVIALAIVATTK